MERKIKICIVSSNLGLGGPQEVISNLALCLDKSIFEVHVVSFMDLVLKKYSDGFSSNGIYLHTLKKKKGSFSFGFLKDFNNLIGVIKPDIISTHVTALMYCCLAKRCKGIPIIHTIHSLPYYDQTTLKRAVIKKHIKSGHVQLVGCSQTIADLASKLYKAVVPFINNGVKKPTSLVKQKIVYDYLVASRLVEMKRIDFIIDAIKDCPSFRNKKLAIVGVGPELEKLTQMVKDNNLGNIHFLGLVENMDSIYSQSKILLMASKWEGNPMTILESMVYGIPTISSNVGGIKDVIKHKQNGLLYEYNDKNAFIENLAYLECDDNYKRLSKNCLNDSAKYSAEEMASNYTKLFLDVMSKSKRLN